MSEAFPWFRGRVWFLKLWALGVVSQALLLTLAFVLVPSGEFIQHVSQLFAYLLASPVGYALVGWVAYRTGRSSGASLALHFTTFLTVVLGFVVAAVILDLQMRAAVDRARREDPFRSGSDIYGDSAYIAREEEIRTGISTSPPIVSLACRPPAPLPSECSALPPEIYETAELSIPVRVREAGRYELVVHLDSPWNRTWQAASHDYTARARFFIAAPGRYRLVWTVASGLGWFFVHTSKSVVTMEAIRVGTYRELYPGFTNPTSPSLDDTTYQSVAHRVSDVPDISMIQSDCVFRQEGGAMIASWAHGEGLRLMPDSTKK